MTRRWLEAIVCGLVVVGCGSSNGEAPADAGRPNDSGVPGAEAGPGSDDAGSGSDAASDSGSGSDASADAGPSAPVTKVDLLFVIDNSASMGDKQQYLEAAIPDLVTAFTQATAFPPVHDMHIGVVSSSLGPRLGDKEGNGAGGVCNPISTITLTGTAEDAGADAGVTSVTLNNHDDDQAHLLTRSSNPALPPTALPTETPLPDAVGAGFLAWFPNVPANSGSTVTPGATAVTVASTLQNDFADLVAGVHEYGCGIESQLESWYRFLIQPDPYASLGLDTAASTGATAAWVGVDTTILKQRHDFLRPDSLVIIIDLTDENDSEIDVRSVGGQGYVFMSTAFYPPHGTAECSVNPADPGCVSEGTSDPAPYSAVTDWGYDINLRHVHMQAKYGLDPQFPLTRYVKGLTSATVPDRAGEYPAGALSYVGTNDCTNPLFAASLPDGSELSATVATQETASDVAALCHLPTSNARPPNRVFFSIIGGVPWQLLHFDPTSAVNSELTVDDWVRILGQDSDNYNYTGIDPHMIESYQPRTGATAPSYSTALPLPALSGPGGTSPAETAPQAAANVTTANAGVPDPYNGREWTTNVGDHIDLRVDREYACIFKLPASRDCSNTNGVYTVPMNGYACDCSSTGLTPDELSPVCDPANPNSQLYAKAYPTIRELSLANKLGAQGIASSICPIDVLNKDSAVYGYRPAITQLVNRVASALTPP